MTALLKAPQLPDFPHDRRGARFADTDRNGHITSLGVCRLLPERPAGAAVRSGPWFATGKVTVRAGEPQLDYY